MPSSGKRVHLGEEVAQVFLERCGGMVEIHEDLTPPFGHANRAQRVFVGVERFAEVAR